MTRNPNSVSGVLSQSGWINSTIEDVAEAVSTGPFGSLLHKHDYITGGVPVINPVNLVGGLIQHNEDVTVSEETAKRLSAYCLRPGDILVGRRGEIGRCALVSESNDGSLCGTGCFFVRPSQTVEPQFLALLLGSPEYRKRLQAASTGTTMLNLSNNTLSKLVIPIPLLEEQKRIVAVLDQAFAALDRARVHAEANLTNATALLAETRDRLLAIDQPDWTSQQLEGLINIKHGFAFKSEFFTTEGAHVLLTPGNFFEEGGLRSRGAKQKYYVGEIPAGYILQEGDLLMVMTEQAPGLLGSCVLVPESDRFLHNQRLGLIQPKKPAEWHSPYFAHVFNQKRFRKALSDSCTGIKVRHTSPDKIKAVYVPVPPTIEIQESIADQLDALTDWIRNLKIAYEAKVADITDLRQSLLRKAFSGELT